jgi:integrase
VNAIEQARFKPLYAAMLQALKLQGKRPKTVDAYARAVRRVADFFERCPDRLSAADLKRYFAALLETHSWSTIKLDRNGLQFFYKHVLDKQWVWVEILKPPQTRPLPDILTREETFRLINTVDKRRYRVFFLTVYSMGLRLGEGLQLEIGDIDGARQRVHIRSAKGGPECRRARDTFWDVQVPKMTALGDSLCARVRPAVAAVPDSPLVRRTRQRPQMA